MSIGYDFTPLIPAQSPGQARGGIQRWFPAFAGTSGCLLLTQDLSELRDVK
jgi:hypothetical protein